MPDDQHTSASQAAAEHWASYVPHDLKYDGQFEDSLMHTVLYPSTKSDGLRVVSDDSGDFPIGSIRQSDAAAKVSHISEHELPLHLSDPRRIFASAIPGVKLTHPAGFVEGGPGLDPLLDTFSEDFLINHAGISTQQQLQQAIDQDTEHNLQLLKERMRARQAAKEKNESIERDLRNLVDQHNMELKIQHRMLEEHEAKKQAKEKKRREREPR